MSKPRIGMYTLKNKDCQAKFKKMTSNSSILTSAFYNSEDLNTCTKQFLKSLNQFIRKYFKKIQIVDKPNKETEELFDQRRILKNLKNLKDDKSKRELEEVENKLVELQSSIMHHTRGVSTMVVRYPSCMVDTPHVWGGI
jgi:hypothetical protein